MYSYKCGKPALLFYSHACKVLSVATVMSMVAWGPVEPLDRVRVSAVALTLRVRATSRKPLRGCAIGRGL